MAKNFYKNLYLATRFATGFAEGVLSTLAARFAAQLAIEDGCDGVITAGAAVCAGVGTFMLTHKLNTALTNAILLEKLHAEIEENVQEVTNAWIKVVDEMTASLNEEQHRLLEQSAEEQRRFQEEASANFQRLYPELAKQLNA